MMKEMMKHKFKCQLNNVCFFAVGIIIIFVRH